MRDSCMIITPENVAFEFELAGLSSRALAWALDIVVMATLVVATSVVLSMLALLAGGFAFAALSIVSFLVHWWYSALTEWLLGGQTLGKRLVGLRTVQSTGLRITFLQAVVRNLVRTVDFLPGLYLVGGVCALMDLRSRRLGDMAAGTIVVRERRAPMPSAVVPESERYNSFIGDPAVALAARSISPPERDAMVALGLRRDELPTALRSELFETMGAHLAKRVGLVRPPFFSPEKFVLNVTAVVLAASTWDNGRATRGEPQ